MNTRSGVKGLVFGGLMAALVVVLVYLFPLPMFLPVPLVLVYARHGLRSALIAGAAAATLATLLLGWQTGLLFVLPMAILPAIALGYGITQKLAPVVTVAAAAVAAFASLLLDIGFGMLIIGQNPLELSIKTWVASMQTSLEFAQKIAPTSPEQIAQTKQLLETLPTLMLQLLPMLLLLASISSAFLAYVACRWILPRFGHEVPPVTPFREWRAPGWLSWPLVLGGAAMLLGPYAGEPVAPWLQRLGLNTVITISYFYVIIGWAVAYHWLQGRFSKGWAVAVLILGFFMLGNLGFLGFLFLGLWDALFDFRKLRSQVTGGNQS